MDVVKAVGKWMLLVQMIVVIVVTGQGGSFDFGAYIMEVDPVVVVGEVGDE